MREHHPVPLPPFSEAELSTLETATLDVAREAFVYVDVDDPLVAWLVYRAEMFSTTALPKGALSLWATRYMIGRGAGAGGFRDEEHLELVRAKAFPDVVSRLTGFYVFPTQEAADRAVIWGGAFKREYLAKVALMPDSRVSKHDAEWIRRGPGRRPAEEWMPGYLRAEPKGDSPHWELVVDGRALVLGTDLRERAYETVRATWPRSLPALELARVAVELGSDLGLITALAVEDPAGVRITYVMNFKDATSPAFLERLAAFDGPKNHADFGPGWGLVVPDLRDREVLLVA